MKVAGLDIGTKSVRLAVESGDNTNILSQKLNFLKLPQSHASKMLLEKYKSSYIRVGEDIYLSGNDAAQLASIFNLPTVSPHLNFALGGHVAHSEELLAGVIGNLVKRAELTKGDKVVFSVPAAPIDDSYDSGYTISKISAILKDLDLSCEALTGAEAVMYNELSETNYTGIVIDFGYRTTSVCCSYMAVPAVSFTIPYGCGVVDDKVSKALGIGRELVSRHRESPCLEGDQLLAYTTYTQRYFQTLCGDLRHALESSKSIPKFDAPATVVLVGGVLCDDGVADYFRQAIKPMIEGLGIKVSEVVVPDAAAARQNANVIGCLLAALSDQEGVHLLQKETLSVVDQQQ